MYHHPVNDPRTRTSDVIRFAIRRSPIGLILAASTQNGLCCVLIGENSERLRAELICRFPTVVCVPAGESLDGVFAAILRIIEDPFEGSDITLDVRGTEFQKSVWQALRAIPPGRTASYADIAKKIGRPSAMRAVAQACASNNIALAIPCHRVVRSDGSLSGYRWGAERKAALLERERAKTSIKR